MKRYLSYLSLTLLGTLAGLIASEGLLRLYPPKEERSETAFFIQYDRQLGWLNRPHAEGPFQLTKEVKPFYVKINSMGLRGAELSHEKQPGIKRMVFIGDSNTFGYGVKGEEAFPSLIAEGLKGSFQILNLGVVGYGTDQELLLMRREAMNYSPDLVILGFSAGNDLYDTMSAVRFGYSKPFFTLRGEELVLNNVPVPERRKAEMSFLAEHSYLYKFLAGRLRHGSYQDKGRSEPAMSMEEGWRVTEVILREMKVLCDSRGCKILIVIIPDGRWLEGQWQIPQVGGVDQTVFNQMLERNGLTYLDLWTPFIKEHRKGKRLYIEGDLDHWNPDGHRLAAEIIIRRIKESGLVE